MISIEEQTTIIFKKVNTSPLKTAISGIVSKNWGPADSGKEEIVVNSITTDSGTAQFGTVNVNIHVPNVTKKINGQDQVQPDNARFEALGAVAKEVLQRGHGPNYNYWTESQQLIRDPSGNWFLNFRLRFKYHNN